MSRSFLGDVSDKEHLFRSQMKFHPKHQVIRSISETKKQIQSSPGKVHSHSHLQRSTRPNNLSSAPDLPCVWVVVGVAPNLHQATEIAELVPSLFFQGKVVVDL